MSLKVKPRKDEKPISYADRLALVYTSKVSSDHKKKLGQFFTPLQVAEFMADFSTFKKSKVRILDPGCGIGILACALVEQLVEHNKNIEEIELVAFETDNELLTYTDACLEYLRRWLQKKQIKYSHLLCKNDFILHNSAALTEANISGDLFDAVIANPPYFKIRKDDIRAIAAKSVIYGQTNIYSIFLILAAKLLNRGGELIFITPRSFASGNYFRIFREVFFSIISITNIHIFASRTAAFERDKILQENIIVVGKKKVDMAPLDQLQLFVSQESAEMIGVSTSKGIDDVGCKILRQYRFADLVNLNSSQKILHIPISNNDENAIRLFKTWTSTLSTYEMEISTGPVVDFRSTEFIRSSYRKNCVPLIYLHNINKMIFNWPMPTLRKGKVKGQYIVQNNQSESRLVFNKDYILLRRFSSKEDKSRLIASPFFSKWLPQYGKLGIENHLNYIYRPSGDLLDTEVVGLAALLNSRLFDVYFRTFNGNINVSATELRNLPLPELDFIKEIGQEIMLKEKYDQQYIDLLIQEKFGIDLNELYG